MADNQPEAQDLMGPPVENPLNELVAVITQALPAEQGFIQVRHNAQTLYGNFIDGFHDPGQLNAAVEAYIMAYQILDHLFNETQPRVEQLRSQVLLQMMDDDQPDQQPQMENVTDLLNRWNKLVFQRDRTRQLLLFGFYAEKRQLDHGYDNRLPWRFQHIGPQLVIHFLNMIPGWMNSAEVRAQRFNEIPGLAVDAFARYSLLKNQNPNLQPHQVPMALFNYTNLFRERNELFQMNEDIIEDGLNLIIKTIEWSAGEDTESVIITDIVDQHQWDAFQLLRHRFGVAQGQRNQVQAFLIDGGYATEEQLNLGYDGNLPPRFAKI